MPPIIKLKDNNNLVSTSDFPDYAKFPFEKFNPVQSRVMEIYDKDCNMVIAAATSAGKTIVAEMVAAYELNKGSGKVIYLAPLKALAKEKLDDWQSEQHHFAKYKIAIMTGDYRLTPERKKEIEEANIVLMTSEMLNSRCRNYESESNGWLKEIATIICDESHLLTVPGRGDHLEVGMMKLAQISPNTRFVLLSATMPNVEEIAQWVSYSLTGRETYLLESTYRPCPLGIHFETYEPQGVYEETEEEKIRCALEIITDNLDDKFLVFVHTKRTGQKMKKALLQDGIECEFHNADLDKEKRHSVEKKFREGKLRVIVATSTLAWGLNLPARRVIITGVHRGLSEVDTYDVWQMAGRAGRPGYDLRGDVYILLPDNKAREHIERLQKHQPIISRLLDCIGTEDPHYKTLAFHLVSEIHHGYIKNREEIHQWYKKTLAHFQAQDLDDKVVDSTLELLIKCCAIKEEDGVLKATVVGTIASMFYYSPFDVADLRRNFKYLFDNHKEDNDMILAMALGNIDTLRMGIVSKAERAEMFTFGKHIINIFGAGEFTEAAVKGGYAYYCLLKGDIPDAIANTARMLQWDFPRLTQVLKVVDGMSGKWKMQDYFRRMQMRVLYGVRPELVDLCQLPDIGKVRAEKLWSSGIRTPQDFVIHFDKAKSLIGLSDEKMQKIRDAANVL